MAELRIFYLLMVVAQRSLTNGELLYSEKENPSLSNQGVSDIQQDDFCNDYQDAVTTSAQIKVKWVPFKDEKCLAAFKNELSTYKEARSFCKRELGADLVAIDFQDKQLFIENYLKTERISNNIWIGLRYKGDGIYEWLDSSVFAYQNWDSNSPKNDSKFCVQMHSIQSPGFGKWSDVLCKKKNFVICEKLQPWPKDHLQIMVINNRKKNTIPLGFIYVQLPKEKSPEVIWPWMTWKDVSSDYADIFFRVEGNKTARFGNVQQPDSPRITEIEYRYRYPNTTLPRLINLVANNQFSEIVKSSTEACSEKCWRSGLRFKTSNTEVRPLNMAVRVWKRTE